MNEDNKAPTHKRKPKELHAKAGRKTPAERVALDKALRALFDQDGITPWRASIIAKCSYEYAIAKYDEFANSLIEKEAESWIERQEKTRKRALEGIAIKIDESKEHIKLVEDQLSQNKTMQNAAMGQMLDDLKESPIGAMLLEMFEQIDQKVLFYVVGILRKQLDVHKNYGFLVAQLIREMRAERTFVAELQQQYDALEITPPAKVVLEAEIEKSIAAKHNLLAPAVPGER